MKRQKLLAVFMAGCMMAGVLGGCGGSKEPAAEQPAVPQEEQSGEAADGGAQEDTGAAPAGETITLSLATTQSSSTPIVQIATKMVEGIKEASGGTVDIQLYPDSTLGSQSEYLEGVSIGTVDMCLIAAGAIETFYDQYAVYSVPFLLRSVDHTYKFYLSEDGQAINDELLSRTGIRVVACFDEGFRQVFSNKPVKSLADFAGLKIRIPDNPLYVNTFNGLGCSATVVALGDLYTGLQTGLVDSFELPTGSAYGNSVYDQVDYCTKTNHIGGAMFLLVNDKVWNTLSAEQQQIILDYAEEASAENRENVTKNDEEQWKIMEESGIEFIDLTDGAYQEIVDKMESVVNDFYGDVLDKEMLDRARALEAQ